MSWLWMMIAAIWGGPLVAAGILASGSFIFKPFGIWLRRHLIG
ncbi:hypothetical protein [Sphingomonas sp. NPDC079357]|jgi:hypothetical protein